MSKKGMAKAKKALGKGKNDECVKVVVRVRPLFGREKDGNMQQIVFVDESTGTVTVKNPTGTGDPKVFTFDQAYGPGDPLTVQENIYNKTAAPLVENVIEGFNGTIFAYGQTGAGKSYTMEGGNTPETEGMMPRAFRHIIDKIGLNKNKNKKFLIRATYLEIYNEMVRDLLGKDPTKALKVKQKPKTGVYVDGLTKVIATTASELDRIKTKGSQNRKVGETAMNKGSSRSHSILSVIIETEEKDPSGDASKSKFRVGKLNLVDLAGSERQKKTQATGDRLKEGTKINLSLNALGNVISALVDSKKGHVPYRDSKLTRLLQDSLGGNTKTIMCANCGPADDNYDETVGTLRYANRAKNIKNKPKINEDPKDAMLREFQDEILKLKAQLEAQNRAAAGGAKVLHGNMMDAESSEESSESEEEKSAEEELAEPEPIEVIKKIAGVDEKDIAHSAAMHEAERKLLERKASIEKKKLEKEKRKQEKKQAKLKAQLEAQEKKRELALKAKRETQERLRMLESKMVSTTPLVDKRAAQEREEARLAAELEERDRRNRAIEEEKKRQEQAFDVMTEDFHSLQEEAAVKGRNLKKAFAAYQKQKQETKDLQAEYTQEREDELEIIRDLTKELKRLQFIVTQEDKRQNHWLTRSISQIQFVPDHHLEAIEKRAKWNEELGHWQVARMLKYAGNSKTQCERVRNNVRPPCTIVREQIPAGRHEETYRRNVYMSREDNVYVPVFTNPYYKYDGRSDSYLTPIGDLQQTNGKKKDHEKRKKKSKKDSRGKSSRSSTKKSRESSSKSRESSSKSRESSSKSRSSSRKDKKDKKKKSKKRRGK